MTNLANLLSQNNTPYGLIEVWEDNEFRWLSIDKIEQSRINTKQPNQLVSTLHQYFLTALLFIDTPSTVLLGGLGGGSLARYFHYKQPDIKGCAIEINEEIATAACNYFDFPAEHWQINITDIQNSLKDDYDLMIIDIADRDSTPDWLINEKMLIEFKNHLSKDGVLVLNLLVNDAETLTQALVAIRKIFNCKTLCSGIPDYKNIIIFAFNRQPKFNTTEKLKHRIDPLSIQWGVDFSNLLEQLKKDNPRDNDIFKL